MGVQTTFREAKSQPMVRPHVTGEGSGAMHVKVNRDEPDFTQTSARGESTIVKREAETDLSVMDGHAGSTSLPATPLKSPRVIGPRSLAMSRFATASAPASTRTADHRFHRALAISVGLQSPRGCERFNRP